MNFIRKTLTTTGYHLFYTLFHPKFWTAVLLVLTVTYIRIRPYAEVADDFNANVSIGILSFIYSDVLFVTVIFISLLLIFSELPFKNTQQTFLLTRSGRRAWCASQILYIIVISIVITAAAALFSTLLLSGNLSFDNKWDKVINSVMSGKLPEGYAAPRCVSPEALIVFSPYKAIAWSLLCGTFCSIMFGLIIFAANLASGRSVGIAIGSVLISLYWLFGYTDKYFLIWFSPLEWASIDTINWRHVSKMPTPEFALGALTTTCVISIITILFCSRKGSKTVRDFK